LRCWARDKPLNLSNAEPLSRLPTDSTIAKIESSHELEEFKRLASLVHSTLTSALDMSGLLEDRGS